MLPFLYLGGSPLYGFRISKDFHEPGERLIRVALAGAKRRLVHKMRGTTPSAVRSQAGRGAERLHAHKNPRSDLLK